MRVLSMLAMFLGAGFLLVIRVRILYFLVLVTPMWLMVLSVLVRVVPHFVPPRLELANAGTVVSLGISDQSDM
jgi:hypothetical protein